jgi:hypothetical protein
VGVGAGAGVDVDMKEWASEVVSRCWKKIRSAVAKNTKTNVKVSRRSKIG